MRESELRLFTIDGIGEVRAGDDLAALLGDAIAEHGGDALEDGDVIVVTSKIVAKAEGRVVRLDPTDVMAKATLVESEATRVLRRRGDLLITETSHGFVCANAGVDLSNVEEGWAVLLPLDPDRSARRLRADLGRRLGVEIAVIISDTFGRAWRNGVTDVAIGCAGIAGIVDLRGTPDAYGRILEATEVCVVDELTSAADLIMGKSSNVPAVVIRGARPEWLREGSVASEVIRTPEEDLFR
ncbi:MAG TPA: coenzyme F420-0:L-glutamate ligase [Acidimicrobiales bacterium]|jgi:coenzyme F420-0:L-glutamate ligase/coenzyme F420-1:gamma-L-glutamate ligase|nr:coenzyme F420-0:L-glutamate ligase [Acidimicrobiales bacterium]